MAEGENGEMNDEITLEEAIALARELRESGYKAQLTAAGYCAHGGGAHTEIHEMVFGPRGGRPKAEKINVGAFTHGEAGIILPLATLVRLTRNYNGWKSYSYNFHGVTEIPALDDLVKEYVAAGNAVGYFAAELALMETLPSWNKEGKCRDVPRLLREETIKNLRKAEVGIKRVNQ